MTEGPLRTSYMEFDQKNDKVAWRQSTAHHDSTVYEDPFPTVHRPRATPRERPKQDPPPPPRNEKRDKRATAQYHRKTNRSSVQPTMPPIDEDHSNDDVSARPGWRSSSPVAYGSIAVEDTGEREACHQTTTRQTSSEQLSWQVVRHECDGTASASTTQVFSRDELEMQPILGRDNAGALCFFVPKPWQRALFYGYLLLLVARLSLLGNVAVTEFSCFFDETNSSRCTVLTMKDDGAADHTYAQSKDGSLLPKYVKVVECVWLVLSAINSAIVLRVLAVYASAMHVPRLTNLCRRLVKMKYFWSQVILLLLAFVYSIYRVSKNHALLHRSSYSRLWAGAVLLLLALEKTMTFLVTCYVNFSKPFSAARSSYSLRILKMCFYTTFVVYLLDQSFMFVQDFMYAALTLMTLPNPNKERHFDFSNGDLILVFLLLAADTRLRYTLWDFFFTKMFYPRKNIFKKRYSDA